LGTAPLILGLIVGLGLGGQALAQSKPAAPQQAPRAADCPPNTRGEPPTVGGPPASDLSERLADSKGVICPPAGIDPEIQVQPPAEGEIKIIPPPNDDSKGRPK
jgi:hypothetical protein